MDSRFVDKMSPLLKRHMTAVPGLCSVTVGYNSSSAGTNRGSVNEGGAGGPCGGGGVLVVAGGFEDGAPRSSVVGDPTGDMVMALFAAVAFAPAEVAAPIGRVDTGGLTIRPFTLKVTAAVTMTPSQVSKADPSSKQTRQPTVALSPKELMVGSTGLHH